MRIIAFGCSYTYGQWLSSTELRGKKDCPNVLSYPSIIAKKLNCPVDNLAEPGSSNKQIWFRIITYKFKPGDIALVHWTHTERFCSIDDKSKIKRFGPWLNTDQDVMAYYKHVWLNFDTCLDSNLRLINGMEHLDRKGIKNFHMRLNSINVDTQLKADNILKMTDRGLGKILNFNLFSTDIMPDHIKNDKALDDKHPGSLVHQWFADQLINQM